MLTGIRVLIIEDVPQLARMMSKALTRYGAEVSSADCGHDGLSLCPLVYPHIVICDYNLPDVTADKLLSRFRGAAPSAKLVVTSGEPQDQMGWDDYLPKPFGLAQLVELVAGLARSLGQAQAS